MRVTLINRYTGLHNEHQQCTYFKTFVMTLGLSFSAWNSKLQNTELDAAMIG